MTNHQIRVVLADDDALVRQALSLLVEKWGGMAVVGEVGSGDRAVELCRKLNPDVVLMDVVMPVMGGLQATSEIVHTCPATKVLAVSIHRSLPAIRSMLRAGARGYVSKKATAAVLCKAIRRVAGGELYLDPTLSDVLVEQLLESKPRRHYRAVLSGREVEVLTFLARGYGNQDIGEKLGISVKTVETYRAHLAEKLGLRNRPAIVQYALDHGLLR